MSDQSHPPPGQLIDVGGYRLHILCAGEGGPTVVLESGLIGLALAWTLVQPEISRTTRVCAYDRAGYGWSDPNPTKLPPTSQRLAQELHTLLANALIEYPYILVAHSFGGFIARMFTNQYPREVMGIALVDSISEVADARFVEAGRKPLLETVANSLKFQARVTQFGVMRWLLRQLASVTTPGLKKVSPGLLALWLDQYVDPRNLRTAVQEAMAIPESIQQVTATPGLGDLPLTVLTPAASSVPWMVAQKELARLSTSSQHVIVERTGHAIHADRPDAVIEAVRQMVETVRLKRSL